LKVIALLIGPDGYLRQLGFSTLVPSVLLPEVGPDGFVERYFICLFKHDHEGQTYAVYKQEAAP
jgi:hypothetical protein